MAEHTVTLEAQELRPGALNVRVRRNGVGGPFFETTDMEFGRRVVATFNAFPDDIPTETITPGLVAEMHEFIKHATNELNAIRAATGAPINVQWGPQGPMQTTTCTEEWWEELTEKGWSLLAKLEKREDVS